MSSASGARDLARSYRQDKPQAVASVRVNKRSLRTTGFVLGAMPWRCDECRLPLAQVRRIRELVPEDAAKVAAYRARRWPTAVPA